MPKWKWKQRHKISPEEQRAEGKRMNEEKLKGMIEAGVEWVEWVEWLTAGDGEECRHCMAMGGKVMRICDLKFMEHPDCEHEDGCRCVVIAVGNPNL